MQHYRHSLQTVAGEEGSLYHIVEAVPQAIEPHALRSVAHHLRTPNPAQCRHSKCIPLQVHRFYSACISASLIGK